MNKKLLALAIGAVIALPATAVAAGPTLYGQIDLSVENVDVDESFVTGLDGEVSTADNTFVMRDNKSRIGIRGEAETGVADLKGIYQAEFGLAADDGDTSGGGPFSQRDIYVGLQGGFGSVKMGNFDTPFRKAQGKVDQFNDSTLDIERYVANETRANDIVQYASPAMLDEALTVKVAVTTEEYAGNADSANSVSVVYDKNGLYLAAAIDNDVLNDGAGVALVGGDQTDAVRLVAGYTADALEVGFLYQVAEQGDLEDTAMMLSGALTAGNWKFKAQYGMTESDDGVPASADPEVTSLAVGADYALGKSTTLYALGGIEEISEAEDGRGVFGVGLRQKF